MPSDVPSRVGAPHGPKRSRTSQPWQLRLYLAGQTPKSLRAVANVTRFCEEHLQGEYELEVIDLVETPHRAHADRILVLPALVRRHPAPIKCIIGDLSNVERVLDDSNVREVS